MRARLLALVAALWLAASPALAWLGDGHMTTGALAYDALMRRDPRAVAAVLRLMRAHPDRARFDANLGALEGAARDRRTFELMARWPDEVRRTPYDRDSWHYDQKVVSGVRYALPFAFGGARRAFGSNLRLARDGRAPSGDRAVALCWLFHIVGDMHQPLHAGMWMDARFPLTDEGGNRSWVRAAPGEPPQKLHWFWDSAGGLGANHRESPAALEAAVAAAHPDDGAAVPDAADYDRWTGASRELARNTVYRRGALAIAPRPEEAKALPADYVARTRTVALERLALAGRRLGALLVGLR